jgi:hypothetical protein
MIVAIRGIAVRARLALAPTIAERGQQRMNTLLVETRKSLGPPWQEDHELAMTAAIVAAR